TEERQNLRTPKLLAQNRRSLCIDPVHLKNMLRQVQSDRSNLAHGWLPSLLFRSDSSLALRCRKGAIHPIIQSPRQTKNVTTIHLISPTHPPNTSVRGA